MLGCWKVDVRVRVRKSNVRGGIKGKISEEECLGAAR